MYIDFFPTPPPVWVRAAPQCRQCSVTAGAMLLGQWWRRGGARWGQVTGPMAVPGGVRSLGRRCQCSMTRGAWSLGRWWRSSARRGFVTGPAPAERCPAGPDHWAGAVSGQWPPGPAGPGHWDRAVNSRWLRYWAGGGGAVPSLSAFSSSSEPLPSSSVITVTSVPTALPTWPAMWNRLPTLFVPAAEQRSSVPRSRSVSPLSHHWPDWDERNERLFLQNIVVYRTGEISTRQIHAFQRQVIRCNRIRNATTDIIYLQQFYSYASKIIITNLI